MKNWEKYKDEILKVAITGDQGALYKGRVVACDKNISCTDCDLSRDFGDCSSKFAEWCQQEYEEPKIQEEVKHCKVDDKILVSRNGEVWKKRHFANYDIDKNVVYVFKDGKTSWQDETIHTFAWEYARLPKENEL